MDPQSQQPSGEKDGQLCPLGLGIMLKKSRSPLKQDNPPLPLKLVWNLYERLPHSFDRVIREVSRSALPFFRLKVALRWFTESAGMGSRSLILVGPLRGSHFLLREFFEGEPVCQGEEEAALWSLADRIAEVRESVDLVIVRLPTAIAGFIRLNGFLNTPFQVGCSRAPMIPEESLPTRNTIRADLKRANKLGLEIRWSRRIEDFEQFYYEMHLPFVLSRFGEDATLYGVHRLRRSFRFGGLLQLVRDGEVVGGDLVKGEGNAYRDLVIGVRTEKKELLRLGGSAVLYRAFLVRALEEGYEVADFGLGRTHLLNGVLRHKRKWGIRIEPRRYSGDRVLYYWRSMNGVVAAFLERTGPILERDGRLIAFALVKRGTKNTREYLKGLWIPGLERIYFSNRHEVPDLAPSVGVDESSRFIPIVWNELEKKPTSALLEKLGRESDSRDGVNESNRF